MPQRRRISSWALVGLLCVLFFPGYANAEFLGLMFGRSANPGNQSDNSLEAGVVAGKLSSVDYRYFGLRYNSRITQNVAVYGDIGTSEFGASDGIPYGLGALYNFNNQKFNPRLDIAIKGSYHAAAFNFADSRLSVTALALEVVISGVAVEGISGYVNFGHHEIDVRFGGIDASKGFGFGAGFALPLGPGEAYAGFNFVDEVTLGLGFRYFIQPIPPQPTQP